LQAGKYKPLQKVIDSDTSPGNQTGPPAGCSSSGASKGAARSSRVAATSGGSADDVGQALPTEEVRVGQTQKVIPAGYGKAQSANALASSIDMLLCSS